MEKRAMVGAAGLFPDDLILEILSRLPARSLHRFKCVSVPWRDLISDPANRKKLPQTLAGFLYMSISTDGIHHHFASVSGAAAPFDPSLPYLHPNKDERITQVGACNGLLLYRGSNKSWDHFRFVVSDPATGRWVELPPRPMLSPANRHSRIAGLAFDPAVSSHFHVIQFEETYSSSMEAVSIYSSRTGAWSRRDCGIAEKVSMFYSGNCVFVGGMMYAIGILEQFVLVGVDTEGKVWKTINLPCMGPTFGTIGSSQGCLHYAIVSADDYTIGSSQDCKDSKISLWCLTDHDSNELVLKYTASIDKLMSTTGLGYMVVAIHPDCDTVFLVSCRGDTLVAYDMQRRRVGSILNLEKNNIEQFLPYVPLFSEPLANADGQ
ncbi:F-box protein [Hordeum vulgare]|nr:F-box protein [Hordeum vulgare]